MQQNTTEVNKSPAYVELPPELKNDIMALYANTFAKHPSESPIDYNVYTCTPLTFN